MGEYIDRLMDSYTGPLLGDAYTETNSRDRLALFVDGSIVEVPFQDLWAYRRDTGSRNVTLLNEEFTGGQ